MSTIALTIIIIITILIIVLLLVRNQQYKRTFRPPQEDTVQPHDNDERK